MLFASIDIGTNAARLLFSNVFTKNGETSAEKASLIRIPLRLGDDVFCGNRISEKKQEELIKTLIAFKLLIEVYKPLAYTACATAAMREATNSKEIVARILQETGIVVKVITGLQEAELITASDNISLNNRFKYKMYIDVGGGSTEISVLQEHEIVKSKSFKIGTIRYLNDKIEEPEWDKMKTWLKEFKADYGNIFLIGSGGNINKIAKVYGHTENQMLYFHELQHAYAHLSNYSLEDRIEKLGLRPDRADVIIPASKIFINIMKWIKADNICVPKIGLADGLIYELYKEYIKNN
jgi:exopolyphosphatase / guanosine-5'-triphosphate,3'-diphosphate pyrophosphatase